MASISGTGAPTRQTKGSVGDIYTNTTNGKQYKCTAAIKTNYYNSEYYEYFWEPFTEESSSTNGVSPTVSVTEIEGGHSVTITDINGPTTFDVMDGEKGDKGDKGDAGSTPKKGVDYFTDAEKEEFVTAVTDKTLEEIENGTY